MSELEKAFIKARVNFPPIHKKGRNPFYKSPAHPEGSPYMLYEDLLEGVSAPLAKEGLYPQHVSRAGADCYFVGSYLVHAPTGEKSTVFEMPIPVDTPQKTGAGITYARRFTLAALLGVSADEDDDGNAAPNKKAGPPELYKATPDQKRLLMKLCLELGLDNTEEMRTISDFCLDSPLSKLKETIQEYSKRRE